MVKTSGEIGGVEIDSVLPLQYLPASLLQIREYCGDAVMWGLFKHYSGQRLAVPRHLPDPEHQLVICLGLEGVKLLVKFFGGEVIIIPVCDAAKRRLRDESVRAMVKAGRSINDVAQQVGLTYRQVQHIAKGVASSIEVKSANLDLFNLSGL